MVDYLNNTGKIPAKIVLKPTLKSFDGVKEFLMIGETPISAGEPALINC